jgi:hypothetical protein
MCRVLNKRKSGIPAGAIYIGRGSKWGNPFRIGPDGDRATVISKYERWLRDQHHLLRALDELRGHHLVCFCAPLACHGDLLLWLANASREHRIAWWRGQIDHRAWRCGEARTRRDRCGRYIVRFIEL